MIYLLGTLGMTSLVLGMMGYLVDKSQKNKDREIPNSRRNEVKKQ